MAYAVFRVAKIKSQSGVSGALAHNHRQRRVPNADPSRSNIELVPAPTRPVAEIIEERTGRPPRANGVLASEIVISASPEYFRPNGEGVGEWDEDKLERWREVMEPWIEQQFPHAASVVLHLDEETPHYQVIDLPLVDDGNGGLKLSHKAKFGGQSRRDIGRWQDYVADAMRPLGIERGIKGSTARHTPQGQYHNDTAKAPSVPRISKPPRIATSRQQYEWAVDETQRIKGILGPAITDLAASAKGRRLAERRARDADKQMEAKETALKQERAAKEEQARLLREERARLRDIPLPEVLAASGWERDPDDKHQWIHPGGVASGRISLKGSKWYDHAAERGAGGAIDLVMHLHEFTQPKDAIGWLRANFGGDATESAYRAAADRKAKAEVEDAPAYTLPPESRQDRESVHKWLTTTRRIATDLADRLMASGRLYATRSKGWVNAVFPFAGRLGAEIKGTQGDFGGNDAGSSPRRDGWIWKTGKNPSRLVVAESPIDALAYHQLHPDADSVLVSTAGAKRSAPPWLEAKRRKNYPNIQAVVAYDNDETGRAASGYMAQSIRGRVHLPDTDGADWSDMLPDPSAGSAEHDLDPLGADDDPDIDPMVEPPRQSPSTGPRM